MERENNNLLDEFNNRKRDVFGQIYLLYFQEFYWLANKLFNGLDMSPDDIVQDVFVGIWENKKTKFKTLEELKVYIYVAIKNRYRNALSHSKCKLKYENQLSEADYVDMVAESELYGVITQAVEMLPSECAKIFKLHLQGWDVNDIAKKLNKTPSTIYKQKQHSIDILKKKIKKEYLGLFFSYF